MTQRQIHMLYMHAVSRIPHAPLTGSCDHRILQVYYPLSASFNALKPNGIHIDIQNPYSKIIIISRIWK